MNHFISRGNTVPSFGLGHATTTKTPYNNIAIIPAVNHIATFKLPRKQFTTIAISKAKQYVSTLANNNFNARLLFSPIKDNNNIVPTKIGNDFFKYLLAVSITSPPCNSHRSPRPKATIALFLLPVDKKTNQTLYEPNHHSNQIQDHQLPPFEQSTDMI